MSILRLFTKSGRRRSAGGLSAKSRSPQPGITAHALSPIRLTVIAAIVVVWCVSAFAMLFQPARTSYRYVPGQIVPKTHYAEIDFHYIDVVETGALEESKADAILDMEPGHWECG